jgi:hypothetical protein
MNASQKVVNQPQSFVNPSAMSQTPDRSILTPFDTNHSPMSQNRHTNWMSSPINTMAMAMVIAMAMNPMGMNTMRMVMHSMGRNGMDQTGSWCAHEWSRNDAT